MCYLFFFVRFRRHLGGMDTGITLFGHDGRVSVWEAHPGHVSNKIPELALAVERPYRKHGVVQPVIQPGHGFADDPTRCMLLQPDSCL